ncbi:MAG: hypothetical protein EA402_07510 [Planctomycetota bacterium]|nr:MAG: hypothetical protein EA402_07510 [Planctomycetota bacterium]
MTTAMLLHLCARVAGACAADTVDRIGGALGLLAWALGLRRQVASQTLSIALGPLSHYRRRRLLRRAYATMGANFLGLLYVGARGPAVLQGVEIAAPQHFQQQVARHPGVVWVTPHLGNWDIGAAVLAAAHGRLQVYARPQGGVVFNAWVTQLRESLGFSVIMSAHGDRRGAVSAMRGLRSGIPLGLLADQGPRPERGVGAWFLGQAVSCHAGPGHFAWSCGVPAGTGACLRRRAGCYRFYHSALQQPTAFPSQEALLQRLLDQLSCLIACAPGQYFWQHRRFKYAMAAPSRPHPDGWRDPQVLRYSGGVKDGAKGE